MLLALTRGGGAAAAPWLWPLRSTDGTHNGVVNKNIDECLQEIVAYHPQRIG